MPDPLYRRIADELERDIGSGLHAPGAKLPTELELMRRYGAARNTVRDAIRWLTKRGLVQTWPGQGTYVRHRIEPFTTTLSEDPETGLGGGEGAAYQAEVQAQGREPFAAMPRVRVVQADGVLASNLRLAAGTSVVSRDQQRYIDGRPYSLQSSFYPMSLVTDGATELLSAIKLEPGAVAYLQERLGLRQAWYSDYITVRAPRKDEADFFELPDGGVVSVFETFRTAYDTADRPFRLTVSVFAADRNRFVAYAGDVPDRARLTGSRAPAQPDASPDA